MFDIKLRYLASIFVNADNITPNITNIAELTKLIGSDNLLPSVAQEITTSGLKNRIHFASLDDSVHLILNSTRFDYSISSVDKTGSNLGDFNDFCMQASSILSSVLTHFNLTAHRIAAVQEGMLQQMTPDQLDSIAKKLLNLPQTYLSNPLSEWIWRVVARVPKEVLDLSETLNCVTTVRKVNVEFNETDGKPNDSFSRIRIDLDSNTVAENVVSRFDKSHIEAFYSEIEVLHQSLFKEMYEFIGAE